MHVPAILGRPKAAQPECIYQLAPQHSLPSGMDLSSTVVGSVGGSGFVFREGVATTYTPPTLPDIAVTDIDSFGNVLGFGSPEGIPDVGFIFSGGQYQSISYPGAV